MEGGLLNEASFSPRLTSQAFSRALWPAVEEVDSLGRKAFTPVGTRPEDSVPHPCAGDRKGI